MTIVFQGRVRSITTGDAAPGTLLVTIATPIDPAKGRDLTLQVPQADGADWIPGTMVSFTIYTFPIDTGD